MIEVWCESLLKRPVSLRGWIALFLAVLASFWFATAHAETFKFESKPVMSRYTATIGGELSFPPGLDRFLS